MQVFTRRRSLGRWLLRSDLSSEQKEKGRKPEGCRAALSVSQCITKEPSRERESSNATGCRSEDCGRSASAGQQVTAGEGDACWIGVRRRPTQGHYL
jgi:hypothetical protein